MYIGKPINEREPDLLNGREREPLVFKNSDNNIVDIFKSPSCGWTHELIEQVYSYIQVDKYESCYDLYLGVKWVGSSEV